MLSLQSWSLVCIVSYACKNIVVKSTFGLLDYDVYIYILYVYIYIYDICAIEGLDAPFFSYLCICTYSWLEIEVSTALLRPSFCFPSPRLPDSSPQPPASALLWGFQSATQTVSFNHQQFWVNYNISLT